MSEKGARGKFFKVLAGKRRMDTTFLLKMGLILAICSIFTMFFSMFFAWALHSFRNRSADSRLSTIEAKLDALTKNAYGATGRSVREEKKERMAEATQYAIGRFMELQQLKDKDGKQVPMDFMTLAKDVGGQYPDVAVQVVMDAVKGKIKM